MIGMTEPEVCLRIAMYYITMGHTEKPVYISLDGAQMKTKNTIHFDIFSFLTENGFKKLDHNVDRWQGEYEIPGHKSKIIICSKSGIGDVNIDLLSGKKLRIECKKGKDNKSGQEYPLMREAVGQIMTSFELSDDIIPVVAVPFSDKSNALANEWSKYSQIKQLGIKFFLVKENDIIVV